VVQICIVMSNSYETSFSSLAISSISSEVCFSLFSQILGGVVGLSFSSISSISFLYPSIVYAIIFIFSSALLFGACTLCGMQSYTVVIPFCSLLAGSFSSSFSEVNCSRVIYNISVNSLPTSKLVTFARALDFNSCIILA
jgi:hypothetical protein